MGQACSSAPTKKTSSRLFKPRGGGTSIMTYDIKTPGQFKEIELALPAAFPRLAIS